MWLVDSKFDKGSDIWGKLTYAFCGGLCLAVLTLFMVSLLGFEIRQKGYSSGKGVFFLVWLISVLSAFFISNRLRVVRNFTLLFSLTCFSVPITYFFKTDISVWSNVTVLWVNLTFFILAACALATFFWLLRICRAASSP